MIQLQNVCKKYGRKQVLKDVTFTANKGEITCLIGINGVGKSTTLKAIMGLTPINKGSILINGEKLKAETFNKLTFIPDAPITLPYMTIRETMDFMSDYYETWNEDRALELLKFFKLNEDDKISTLSKGNNAKINLLLGLSLDVDFVLMDEPFSGIDMFSREQIANVFTSHLIEDRGVIITTHEINDIEHLIDKAVLIENGTVIKEFYTEEVRNNEGKSVIDVLREVYNS
ncbi:MAG: ytrB 1 [Bacillales bacterium]|nr:ytrB 1 [Bacillales bacterium]